MRFIMKKLSRLFLVTAITLSTVNTVMASGIPVADGASLAQSAKNFVEQIANMKQQVENQIAQITELKNQVQAMTGGRALGNIARETIDQAIPDEWKEINKISKIDLNDLKTAKGYDPQANITALNTMVGQVESIFNNTIKRQGTIQALMKEVDNTTDIKASADLQNRISAEQASIANNQTQLDQLYKAYQLQKEINYEKAQAYQECLSWQLVDGRNCG